MSRTRPGMGHRLHPPGVRLLRDEGPRCFCHDFFARHRAPLLTTVMCAWDVGWMQAIDPAVSGLRAERTSLRSLGDDECRFAVLETDDPRAGYTDILDKRFADPPPAG